MHDNNIHECHYKVNAPYPPVRVDGPNPVYADKMLSNMGDVVSEMSDITRYFYIAVVAKPQFGAIATCFHHISIVEMHHLNIFAELAMQLGADPRLWCGRPRKRWWSPSFISYPREICALIAESIEAERAAIRKYTRQANIICDRNIVAILNRIILDEKRHIQIFKEMYQQLQCL
ncbi:MULTISPECIES: ferritin-like domain-containing protein [Sporomusa]|uniref:Rubrerythrin n=1 Tax=Sporomusa sphaeroides DSM 2875 TaxID=1337886 RepID=A0ABM9W5T9_9FIRM|nr:MULTISPECIES: ferritin family protein [Sporomusa]OLS55134.1 rubrerythrin [Sporomusa sphaeroides DSM 2875]CVK20528.1 Rubrerythrin [Sporomusa sphaeroides DSM 2875]